MFISSPVRKFYTLAATILLALSFASMFVGSSSPAGAATVVAHDSVTYSCPNGGTLSGQTCTTSTTATYAATGTVGYSCPSGGTLSGTNCATTTSTPATPTTGATTYSCPSGGTLSGTSCITSSSSSYAATYSQTGSSGGYYYCPSGGTLSGSSCDTSSSSTYAATSTESVGCAAGWNPYGLECSRTIETTSAGCAADGGSLGASLGGGEYNCQVYTSGTPTYTYSCPSGGTLNGTTCDVTTDSSYAATYEPGTPTYSYTCPNGGTLDGTTCDVSSGSSYAATATTGSTTYSCSSGTLDGQNCDTTTDNPATAGGTTYSCPNGGTLSGQTCTDTTQATYPATASNSGTGSGGGTGGTTPPPPVVTSLVTPTGITTQVGNESILVTWTPGASGTTYTVTATDNTNAAHGGQTCKTTSDSCLVTGLTNGDSYTFVVTATLNGSSLSSPPTTPVDPEPVPNAPVSLHATAGSGSATVTWKMPPSNGTSVITGYTVTSIDSTDAKDGGQSCITVKITCKLTGLTNGNSYTFVGTSTNKAGPSLPSIHSNAVTPLRSFTWSTNFTTTAVHLSKSQTSQLLSLVKKIKAADPFTKVSVSTYASSKSSVAVARLHVVEAYLRTEMKKLKVTGVTLSGKSVHNHVNRAIITVS